MLEFLSVAAFAVALSLDGFGVGVAYGMRKIKIPILSLVVISLTSSIAIGISMLFGHLVAKYISIKAAEIVGALILISVGAWIVIQIRSKKDTVSKELLNLRIKPLGLVIHILREPTIADFDKSGIISIKEALILGFALAMDSLGAGFGAAMAGFKPLLTIPVVGMAKFFLVNLGVYTGRNCVSNWLGERTAGLPGWVLILLGLASVIKI
jgi:putative sporulation protein YtaF